MFEIILDCIGMVILAIGIVFAYDARKLTYKYLKDKIKNINKTTRNIKISGMLIGIIGGIIILL
ncbi:MAG: hypothetical protein E7313_06220 [Clostridiales bacterium]|nr:hypothetical protein [Clostridiales bacterium]